MSLNEQQVKYPESYYNPNEHPLKDLITPTSYKKGNLIKVSAYDTARVRDFFCQVGAVVSRQQIQVIETRNSCSLYTALPYHFLDCQN